MQNFVIKCKKTAYIQNEKFGFARHKSQRIIKHKEPFVPAHPKPFLIFANIRQVNIKIMKSRNDARVRTLIEKQHLYLR